MLSEAIAGIKVLSAVIVFIASHKTETKNESKQDVNKMSSSAVEENFRGNFEANKIFNNYRKNGKYCDFSIIAKDDKSFSVHKVIIAASSPFFEAKFNNPLFGDFTSHSKIDFVSSEVLNKIIEYMYTAEVTINSEYAKEMLDGALYLGLDHLVNQCTEVLMKTISLENCLELLNYSETYHLSEKLENNCIEFILKNINTVTEFSDFVKISSDAIEKILKHTRNGCSEESLYLAAVKWISYNLTKRNRYIQSLLDLIDFKKISHKFCKRNIFENNPLSDNIDFLKKMLEIQKINNELNIENDNDENPILLSKCDFKMTIGKFTQQKENLLTIFNKELKLFVGIQNNYFHSITNLEQIYFGYSYLKNYGLFICGGEKNGKKLNTCQYYLLSENSSWKNLTSMKISRSFHRTVLLNDQIYACAGLNENSIEIFNINKNLWIHGPSLPKETEFCFGLSTINNCIYLNHKNDIFHLDPRENIWNNLTRDTFNFDYPNCSSIGFDNYYLCRFDRKNITKFDVRNVKSINDKLKFEKIYNQTPHTCMNNNELNIFGKYELPDGAGASKFLLQKCNPNSYNMRISKNHLIYAPGDLFVHGFFSVD